MDAEGLLARSSPRRHFIPWRCWRHSLRIFRHHPICIPEGLRLSVLPQRVPDFIRSALRPVPDLAISILLGRLGYLLPQGRRHSRRGGAWSNPSHSLGYH